MLERMWIGGVVVFVVADVAGHAFNVWTIVGVLVLMGALGVRERLVAKESTAAADAVHEAEAKIKALQDDVSRINGVLAIRGMAGGKR